jgi:threonine aldolase
MANQTAIKLHTQPGEQLIADKYAHVYHYEGGGASFNSGVPSSDQPANDHSVMPWSPNDPTSTDNSTNNQT